MTGFNTTDTRLICGECVKQLNKFPNNSIDLIVTDPPYKTTARGNAGSSGGMF